MRLTWRDGVEAVLAGATVAVVLAVTQENESVLAVVTLLTWLASTTAHAVRRPNGPVRPAHTT